MANIQSYLNQIKNAVFGKEVRESIHDAIKQCYDDAAVNHDNANMEVKLARGTHDTLNDRLVENEKNQENLSSQLDTKANNLDLEVQKVRIDNLITNNNPTDGNSELIDIRVGRNGDVYTSAGEAVRNELDKLYNTTLSLDILSKNINNEDFLIDRTYIDKENGNLVKENKEHWVTTFPINCSSMDFITISNYEIHDIRYRTLDKDLQLLTHGKSSGNAINVSNAFFIQVCYPVSEKGKIMIERGQNKSNYKTFKKIDVFTELEKLFDCEINLEFKQYSGIKGGGYIWTNRVESEKDSYSTIPIVVTKGEKYRIENINRMSYFYDENMIALKRIEFDEFSTFEVGENVKYIAFSCYCKDVPLSKMKLYRLGSVNEEVLTSKKSNNAYNNSHKIISKLYPRVEPILGQRNNVYNIPCIGSIINKNSILDVTGGHFLIENSIKKIDTKIKRATHCFSQPNNDFFKDPELHYENGKYYMFATGLDVNKNWEIQYATANKLDGNWTYGGTCLTREGCSPLLTNGNIWAPTLIKKDNLWYMFITDGRNSFLATSSTLNGEWTWNTNVCFMAFDGHVIHENGMYYMIRTTGSTIRYKTSKDLLNWSTESVIMFNTNNYDWCEEWTEAPFIFKYDNTYYCFYGSADSGDKQRLGVAVSSSLDGEWVDLGEINIIVPESSKNVLAHPCVLRDNGIFYLYFCGTGAKKTSDVQGGAENFRMFRYKSNDLINWTPVDYETNLKPNSKELVYLNTCGELEFTTEVQNPSQYQVAYIETDSNSKIIEIKNLLPYLEGDNKVKNGYFDNNLDNWLISNNNSTNPSIYNGTISASISTDIVQKGLDNSCILTSETRAYGGIKQTIKDNSFNVGDYIAVKCYLKNKNCSKVKLITNIKCRTTNDIIFSSTNEIREFDGWTPLTSVLKIPNRNNTTIYFGKYSIEVFILCDIDNGQQLNISDVQVVKINKQLVN